MPPDDDIPTGHRQRRRRLIRTAVRSARRDIGSRIRAGLAPPEKRNEILERAQVMSAKEAARTLGGMKGMVMKMGQMISFVAQGLPDDVRAELATLQQEAPPMSWAAARAQIERELGRPADEVFAHIDTEPAASASIGQVHRATMNGGGEVALKVQFPGVDDAIRADFENVGLLKILMRRMAPGVNIDPYVDEFRERVEDELDYRAEARHQQDFADAWAGDDVVVVPEVIHDLTSRRLLVTRWYEGERFEKKWMAPQEEKNRVGREIYRYAQICIAQKGMFNGDPHPGNYIFLDDGRIVFLDFGCIKRLSDDALAGQQRLVRAVRGGDPTALKEALVATGYTDPADPIEPERLYDFVSLLNEPILEDRDYQFTPAARIRIFRMLAEPDNEYAEIRKSITLPGDLFLLMRLNAGLEGILSALLAEANWHRLHRECWGLSGPDPG